MDPLLCGLAANPALPGDLVDHLIARADDDLAHDLARRPDLSHAQALALMERVTDSAALLAYEGRLTAADVDPATHPDAVLALLDRGAGRAEWARLLARDPDRSRRERLATCPDLPPDVVDALAADPDVRVVAELALWTTSSAAARLAGHPHAEVRRAVAANESTPPASLEAVVIGTGLPALRSCLVCDREEIPFVHDPYCPRADCDLPSGASCDGSHESARQDILDAALRNPALPAHVLVGFVDHPSALIRRTLADRPDLPRDVYERLAADPAHLVRVDLAGNPALDDALIRLLAEDPGADVRRRVAAHPRVPLDVLTRLARTAKAGGTLLPRVAAASAAEVAELAASPDPAARMVVAHRRDLPPGVRDRLATDLDAKVLKALAPHPGLSEAQLRDMVDRHGVRVLARVATNPDASAALLEDLTRHRPPVQKVFRQIARHDRAPAAALVACLADSQARPLAAAHAALPPEVVVGLLRDTDPQVVEAAAANPSLPVAVMAELVHER
ncbi:hypothetical protein [Streptomyces mangrovisoli]|uniref:Leucine rich repeat variant n=1 Tax=Streptomyces mangrovisoli TaxID=1428628 RepID=A0A1J4NT99_9ACTN|nr:hypothetical protein [Streptomyces mangrovisoli]OIJ64453.1 hypothetical protein WN71_028755 [Streptomyces mangrovisoli]